MGIDWDYLNVGHDDNITFPSTRNHSVKQNLIRQQYTMQSATRRYTKVKDRIYKIANPN